MSRKRVLWPSVCPSCGYSLHGHIGGAPCPECGIRPTHAGPPANTIGSLRGWRRPPSPWEPALVVAEATAFLLFFAMIIAESPKWVAVLTLAFVIAIIQVAGRLRRRLSGPVVTWLLDRDQLVESEESAVTRAKPWTLLERAARDPTVTTRGAMLIVTWNDEPDRPWSLWISPQGVDTQLAIDSMLEHVERARAALAADARRRAAQSDVAPEDA